MLQWSSGNPKKAGLLGLLGLVYSVKKVKQFLATPKDLTDKVVVITGGGAGLGFLIAEKLLNKGAILIIWDVNKTAINDINTKYNGNPKIIAKFVDVTSKKSVDIEAKAVLTKYGKCDMLINNAGVVAGRPLLQLTERDIRRTFEVNIISHFWTLKAFLPDMIKRKSGHIVNIISTSAFCPVSHLTDYATTKAAARYPIVCLSIY